MIHTPTHVELENRELLTEAATNTATLAILVARQSSIAPGYRIALQDAVEALERVLSEGREPAPMFHESLLAAMEA